MKQRKTSCCMGHPFTPENVRTYKGWRACKTCRRITDRLRYRKQGYPKKRSTKKLYLGSFEVEFIRACTADEDTGWPPYIPCSLVMFVFAGKEMIVANHDIEEREPVSPRGG